MGWQYRSRITLHGRIDEYLDVRTQLALFILHTEADARMGGIESRQQIAQRRGRTGAENRDRGRAAAIGSQRRRNRNAKFQGDLDRVSRYTDSTA